MRDGALDPRHAEEALLGFLHALGDRRGHLLGLAVADGDGTVGVGYGKAKEVPAAIAKGVEEAKKNFFKVPRIQGTIPHPVQGEAAAGVVFLRPASPGTGVIAGGPVRAVLELSLIHISEPTRQAEISYAVFCLKKKKKNKTMKTN